MCTNTTPNPGMQPSQPTQDPALAKELTALDVEFKRAETQQKIAEIRFNAEFNASPAGQLQRQFEAFQRVAQPLASSKFVPAAYQGNIGDCIIAVEMASRLNVFPLTVMQNLCIVKGTPTWKSKFLIGCVNTCGRYTTLDYRVNIDGKVGKVMYKTWEKVDGRNTEVLRPFDQPDLANVTCVAYAIEKSSGKELVSPPVSIRMAVQEGWYCKDGSKWPTMPELMLRYRAASYWVSTFAPEMAMGFRTVEEQEDIVDTDYEDLSASITTSSLPRPTARPTSAAVEAAKERLRTRDAVRKAAEPSRSQTPEDNVNPQKSEMPS